ncbi:MAG: ABC transporter permease [Pseudomonadota bacterium]
MSFTAVFLAEMIKLRRSLVLLLIISIPLMMAIMLAAAVATDNAPDDWTRLTMSFTAVWAYLLMPLAATALTALMAHLEHGPKGWSFMLALPAPKWSVFAAKALLAACIMALICVLIALALPLGAWAGALIAPTNALDGAPPAGLIASLLSRMWLAGLLALAIQFAVAMAFSSFAAPVVLGMLGVFVSVVATSAKAGIYFPWLLAVNVLASTPERALQAVLTGGIGGVLVFALTCWWLARRDWL